MTSRLTACLHYLHGARSFVPLQNHMTNDTEATRRQVLQFCVTDQVGHQTHVDSPVAVGHGRGSDPKAGSFPDVEDEVEIDHLLTRPVVSAEPNADCRAAIVVDLDLGVLARTGKGSVGIGSAFD